MNHKEKQELKNRAAGAERHFAAHGMKTGVRQVYRGVEFVTAVGVEPVKIVSPENEDRKTLKEKHPNGFYEAAFIVFKGEKPWFGGGMVFDRDHDVHEHWTEEARIKARFNAAEDHAKQAIDDGLKAHLESLQ